MIFDNLTYSIAFITAILTFTIFHLTRKKRHMNCNDKRKG